MDIRKRIERQINKLVEFDKYISSKEVELKFDSPQSQKLTQKYRVTKIFIQHRLRSLKTLQVIQNSQKILKIKRIILGAGPNATFVFANLHHSYRSEKEENGLPMVLAFNDPDNPPQWAKDGDHLIGQPAELLRPACFTSLPDDYKSHHHESSNPYHYVSARDFHSAMTETHNTLNMHVVNWKINAAAIESRDQVKSEWKDPESPHRICVGDQHIYTQAIDICVGLGKTTELDEKQVDPDLAKQLKEKNKLIYGQNDGDPVLKGVVVFYGGGARNAGLILEIIKGKRPDVTQFIWIARTDEDFERNKNINRMFCELVEKKQAKMGLASLGKVEELKNGKVRLHLSAPTKFSDSLPDLTGQIHDCDHLVATIGATPLKELVQNGSNLNVYAENDIPCGIYSPNGINIWGAAATTGMGLEESCKTKLFQQQQAHAEKMVFECFGVATMMRAEITIKKMAQGLQKMGLFPANDSCFSANINQATQGELIDLLKDDMDAEKLVQEIIGIRCKSPGGIQTIDQLKDLLKADLLKIIEEKYFMKVCQIRHG